MTPYQTLEACLRLLMQDALNSHGSVRRAADAIGMPRSSFHDKAREFGLDMRRKPKAAS